MFAAHVDTGIDRVDVERLSERTRAYTPTQRLWLHCLRDGLRDIDHARHWRTGLTWLLSDHTHIGSAIFLCEVLGLNLEYLRRMIPHALLEAYVLGQPRPPALYCLNARADADTGE